MAAHLLREAGIWVQLGARFSASQLSARGYPALRRVKVCRFFTGNSARVFSSQTKAAESLTSVSSDEKKEIQPVLEIPDEESLFRERFIPITRRSLVRYLMEEKDFLLEEEKKIFEDFSVALDSAIVNKYHGILQEVKNLFDPINPDKDTVQTRKWNRREQLDNEFWLLQRLEDLMEKANFHELPKSEVHKVLHEHEVRDGVRVSVDPDKYDILRFWALGKERPTVKTPWYKSLFWKSAKQISDKPTEYYKRVVVAIRLKKDQKLLLKSFKEVPINSLEMLLPDGKIQINKMEKTVLVTSIGFAVTGVVAKIVTMLAHLNVDWTLVVTGVTGLIGVQSWTTYKNRKNAYLVELSRMLYFKNVANNRGLLALLVDRAEDESMKEALLTYTFLLTNRPPSAKLKGSQHLPIELGNIPDLQLEKNVEEWINIKTAAQIEFDSSEAVKLLQTFGLLSTTNGNLHVLPLEAALRNLPQQPQSLVARATDSDTWEGYDRDYFEETEEEYKEEEKKSKKYGWF